MSRREHREYEEQYMLEQEQSHWHCSFFRYCWNEGLKLPTTNNCPECRSQYLRYRQTWTNRRPIHERLGSQAMEDDRHLKISKFEDHRREKFIYQGGSSRQVHSAEEEVREYVWQKGQWCPPGLRKSQKRRVQRLRNREHEKAFTEEEAAAEKEQVAEGKRVWHPKKKPDERKPSVDISMAFFLPAEFEAPEDQDVQDEAYSDFDETEFHQLLAHLVLAKLAVFDKPIKHRHLKPPYLKGYVNGKPLTKMLVDAGAGMNIMPYTMFRKLGMTNEDLLETDLILTDFAGHASETKDAMHVELTVGNKTLITTFFVIDGKGAYSLLVGRDWIHANCCVPSTMHQILIQWIGDDVEIVHADNSVSVAASEPEYWEFEYLECFSGKEWEAGPVKIHNRDQQPIQAAGSDEDV